MLYKISNSVENLREIKLHIFFFAVASGSEFKSALKSSNQFVKKEDSEFMENWWDI